uniref:Uncharacterized protein n=1 Tax=Parascaris equorum TaxID=6256 RepID=A0A914S2A9_PAREQ
MEVSEEFDDEREQRFHHFVRQHIVRSSVFLFTYYYYCSYLSSIICNTVFNFTVDIGITEDMQ